MERGAGQKRKELKHPAMLARGQEHAGGGLAPEIKGLQAGQEGERCRDGGGAGRSNVVVAGRKGVGVGSVTSVSEGGSEWVEQDFEGGSDREPEREG